MKPGLHESSTVVASPNQISTELGDEVVILSTATGKYYSLEAVGHLIWQLIEEPRTLASLQEAVRRTYDVEGARSDDDVVALLGELSDAELIEIR